MRSSEDLLDTIVAPATPSGRSALALVRISGPETLRVLRALAPRLAASPQPRHPYLVFLEDGPGQPIDEGLVTFYAGPASPTGEDVGEISVHGSPAVVERLLRAAIRAGARVARAGEFTERAFRLGKIDLLRAEAVRDLIEARTPAAAEAGAHRLAGRLSDRVEAVPPSVAAALEAAIDSLTALSKTYEAGRLLADGCRVAILGRPNAGKSTLFNALAGEQRAIVTDIPGTTRDALEASIDIGGIPVTLVDTAGLRTAEESVEPVERIGVERAWEQAERSDAILYVFDASAGWEEEDANAIRKWAAPQSKWMRVVANKIDRPGANHPEPPGAMRLCGLSPDAGPRLRASLQEILAASIETEGTSELLGSIRQRDLVDEARGAAAQALGCLRDGLSPEYAATHCHAALDALADLTGETTAEDVLSRLFSTFCIGK
jgi:tRNA modification GTPase